MSAAERKRERHRAYMLKRYQQDAVYRERHKAAVRVTRERQRVVSREIIADAKVAGCSVCDEQEPCCLDFHHEGDKEFHVSAAMRGGYCERRLRAEIAKCVVVCANCHRKLHAGLVSA